MALLFPLALQQAKAASPPAQAAGYSLVFSDDFTSLSLSPNGKGNYTWYDGVWFYHKPAPLANISAANSELSLVWSKNQGPADTSIETLAQNNPNYQAWRYGYFEARMKWDVTIGAWPAFWLTPIETALGTDFYNGVQEQGEFDIFEGQGDEPYSYFGTIHDWVNGKGTANANNRWPLSSSNDFSQYHTYGMLWVPGKVTWYFDNQPLMSAPTPAVVDKQTYLMILGMQEGAGWQAGNLGGVTASSMKMNVDWVHVWQLQTADIPSATSQTLTAAFNTPLAITLSGSDPAQLPLSYAIVTLPANGQLSGSAPNLTYTPNAGYSGVDSFSFKVNNGLSDSATATVSLTINPAPVSPLSLGCPASTATLGASYSSAFTASGGLPPYNFSVAGSLPSGLSATPGGAISGTTLTPGSTTFTATLSDSSSPALSVSSSCTIAVAGATLSTAASANFVGADSATRGNWRGVYGADGSSIANDSANIPSYAALTPGGTTLLYTWSGSTADARALLKYLLTADHIASTYYGYPGFTLDLNFSDGQAHRVALYCLDWDYGDRAQTITISDASSGAILDSRTASAFQGGQYLIWTIAGHVQIQAKQLAGPNAVISGLFFDTPGGTTTSSTPAPAVSFNAPAANQTVTGTATLSATASSAAGIASLQYQVDGANLTAAVSAGPPYVLPWDSTTVSNGPHNLKAVATDNRGQQASASLTVNVNNVSAGGATTTTFVKTDTTTQGNWKGIYGRDGEMIANDSSALPGYAAASALSGALPFTWTITQDLKALQQANGYARTASTYYTPGSSFSLDLNLTDGNSHQFAVYLLDWDNGGRAETITLRDAVTQAVLDSRLVAGFSQGEYLVWNVKGHINVQFTLSAGSNAVASGFFLGPGS